MNDRYILLIAMVLVDIKGASRPTSHHRMPEQYQRDVPETCILVLTNRLGVTDTTRRSPATDDPAPVGEERDTPPESDAVDDALENVDYPAERER